MKTYFDSSVILEYLLSNNKKKFPDIIEKSDKFTSKLTQVEVLRNIRKRDEALLNRALTILSTLQFIDINDHIIDSASTYPQEITLKSSDAIHMATAEQILDVDDLLITFDKQMAANAERLGLKVFTSF